MENWNFFLSYFAAFSVTSYKKYLLTLETREKRHAKEMCASEASLEKDLE